MKTPAPDFMTSLQHAAAWQPEEADYCPHCDEGFIYPSQSMEIFYVSYFFDTNTYFFNSLFILLQTYLLIQIIPDWSELHRIANSGKGSPRKCHSIHRCTY